MLDRPIVARGGERLELFGQTSLRELTLTVTGMSIEVLDGEGTIYLDTDLELDRPDVLELRDRLNEWLARGDI